MKPAYLYILVCGVLGCGTLRAPNAPFQRVQEKGNSGIELSAVEGRPAGLVLRIRADVAGAEAIELYRAPEGEDASLLQAFELASDVRATFVTGVEIVDSTIRPGAFQYQLVARSDGVAIGTSEVVDVQWRQPPPRPDEVAVAVPFADVVEVTWASAEFPAVVFRRDVLAEGEGFVRVAEVAGGVNRWVDRDVSAGGVWSYRVAFAFGHPSGLMQYGKATEEMYVTTPEAQ